MFFFFLILRRPPISTCPDTLFPYVPLFRSLLVLVAVSSVMWVALGTAQKNTLALVRQVADFSVAGLIDQIGYHLGSAQQQSEVLAAMMQRGEIDIDDRERLAGALRGALAATSQVTGIAYFSARGWSLRVGRSEEHTSELQSLMRTSYAVFC